jgi:hypothetical protein
MDPPVVNLQAKQADEGVGCGPGGPPHFECKLLRLVRFAGVLEVEHEIGVAVARPFFREI